MIGSNWVRWGGLLWGMAMLGGCTPDQAAAPERRSATALVAIPDAVRWDCSAACWTGRWWYE
jgi:hypothetical protein